MKATVLIFTFSFSILGLGEPVENAAAGHDHSAKPSKSQSELAPPSDPYWAYYAACDRWEIQFPNAAIRDSIKTDVSSSGATKLKSSRPKRSNPAMRTVGYRIPKKPRASLTTTLIGCGWQQVQSFAGSVNQLAQRGSRYVEPTFDWLEFQSVESARYQEFHLSEKGIFSAAVERARQRLGRWVGTQLDRVFSVIRRPFRDSFLSYLIELVQADSVSKPANPILNGMLQKGTHSVLRLLDF